MRKALITLVVVISVGAAVAAWHADQPRHTPSGQPPLDSLNPQNLADFRKMFNSSASSVRLVLLLSPTRPGCLRGASATESLLEQIRDRNLYVLVVWEPILPTDWEPVTTAVLARIHTRGVTQFWDHDHLVAGELSRELASNPRGPKPHCCTVRGNLWDFAALYPKGALWQAAAPQAAFADGPVVDVQSSLSRELRVLLSQKN